MTRPQLLEGGCWERGGDLILKEYKRINNLSADETTFNKSKDLYNNALAESGF